MSVHQNAVWFAMFNRRTNAQCANVRWVNVQYVDKCAPEGMIIPPHSVMAPGHVTPQIIISSFVPSPVSSSLSLFYSYSLSFQTWNEIWHLLLSCFLFCGSLLKEQEIQNYFPKGKRKHFVRKHMEGHCDMKMYRKPIWLIWDFFAWYITFGTCSKYCNTEKLKDQRLWNVQRCVKIRQTELLMYFCQPPKFHNFWHVNTSSESLKSNILRFHV